MPDEPRPRPSTASQLTQLALTVAGSTVKASGRDAQAETVA